MQRKLFILLVVGTLLVLVASVNASPMRDVRQTRATCDETQEIGRNDVIRNVTANHTICYVVTGLNSPQYFYMQLRIHSGSFDLYRIHGDVSSIPSNHRVNEDPMQFDSPRYSEFRPPWNTYTIAVVPRGQSGRFTLVVESAAPRTASLVTSRTGSSGTGNTRRATSVIDYGSFYLEAEENAQFQIPFTLACNGPLQVDVDWRGADYLYVIFWSSQMELLNPPGVLQRGGTNTYVRDAAAEDLGVRPWRLVVINPTGVETHINNLTLTIPDHDDCVAGFYDYTYLSEYNMASEDSIYLPGDEIVGMELQWRSDYEGIVRIWYSYNTSWNVERYIGADVYNDSTKIYNRFTPIRVDTSGVGDISVVVVRDGSQRNFTTDRIKVYMYTSEHFYAEHWYWFEYDWVAEP